MDGHSGVPIANAVQAVALDQDQEQGVARVQLQVMEVQIARETPPKQQSVIQTHVQVRYIFVRLWSAIYP